MPLVMSLEGPAVAPADKIKAGLYAVTPKGVLRAGFQFTNQLEGVKETVAAWPTWMKWLVGGTAVLGVVGVGCAVYNYRRTSGNLRGGRLGAASARTRLSAEAIADFDEGHIQPGIELRNEFPRNSDTEIIALVSQDIEDYRDTWKDQHGDDVEASGADLDEAFEAYKARYVNLTRDRLRRVPRAALEGARSGTIILERDGFTIRTGPKGKGYEVYKEGDVAATRVAVIGYDGDKGLQRAKEEIARRSGKALEGVREDNARRKEIAREEQSLYNQSGYAGNTPADNARIQARLAELKAESDRLGPAPATKAQIKRLRARLEADLATLQQALTRPSIAPRANLERRIKEIETRLAELPGGLKGAKAPADCHTLASQIWKATNAAANAMDRPNLTNSEAQALHNKHRARVEKLEVQYKAQGC